MRHYSREGPHPFGGKFFLKKKTNFTQKDDPLANTVMSWLTYIKADLFSGFMNRWKNSKEGKREGAASIFETQSPEGCNASSHASVSDLFTCWQGWDVCP